MKHILMVLTGGTIGSTVNAGTIDTSNATHSKLLQLFQQHDEHPEDIDFHCIQPLQLLSENLAPCVWQTLISAIEAEPLERYDGIIVTHGTDTLAYTACALSFYFHALKIPVLLVSSDYPLDETRANGLVNFQCAVEFIRQNPIAGVFVPYRNAGRNMEVHQGTHLTCSPQLSSDFFSVEKDCPFMLPNNKQFHALVYRTKGFHENSPLIKTKNKSIIPLQARFDTRITLIRPYPALDYRTINLQHTDAVLHDLYHSGTACTTTQWGEQHSLIAFIRRCKAEKIAVYITPAFYSDNAYQSTRELMDNGAMMLWNLSIEAAYTKLLLAYGNFDNIQDIMNFMNTTIANEHVC